MLFGYMIVRALLPIVRVFGRLPDGAGRLFTALLNSATRPFHIVNYLGSVSGATVFNRRRMGPKLDRVIASLHCSLDAEPEERLRRDDALPTALGSLLQRSDKPGRGLPIRNPVFRPPPATTHPLKPTGSVGLPLACGLHERGKQRILIVAPCAIPLRFGRGNRTHVEPLTNFSYERTGDAAGIPKWRPAQR